jgi:hypothetical protein
MLAHHFSTPDPENRVSLDALLLNVHGVDTRRKSFALDLVLATDQVVSLSQHLAPVRPVYTLVEIQCGI